MTTGLGRELRAFLARCEDDAGRALVSYELWQLDPGDEPSRRQAAALYRALPASQIYGEHGPRYRAVTGQAPPPPPPLPKLPEIVRQTPIDLQDLLAEVNQLLADSNAEHN